MKYEVYAKAALKHDQINAKIVEGCGGIEIQLLGEMLGAGGNHNWNPNVFDNVLSEYNGYPISVVHAPIIPGHGDTTIERLVDDTDYALVDGVFRIANYFGQLQSKIITIVFHTETYPELVKDLGNLWGNLCKVIDSMLNNYPYVKLAIENVSPLRGIGKDAELHLANNFAFDNVDFAEQLRSTLGTTRIGTCLDTCHAFLTEKYIGGLYDLVADRPKPDYSIKKYYERNQSVLFLMHVSNIFGSGYGAGRHGVSFTDETYDKLVQIITLHDVFVPNVPITLEVEESDFLNPIGYRETARLIHKYYATKN